MSMTIPLGEVVEIRSGGAPRRTVPKYWGGHIPWATVEDFSSTRLGKTRESITLEGIKNSGTKIVPMGSIIVPTRIAIGKAAISAVDLALDQDLKALLPKDSVYPKFLLHFLLSKSEFLEDQARRTIAKEIKPSLLRSLEIPNLCLDEQRRIAAVLDKADDIRRKREQTLAMIEKAIDATFLEIFGDPAVNPMGWRVLTMDALGILQGGLQDSWKRHGLPLRKPCLGTANVFRNRIAPGEVRKIGLTASEFERIKLQRGDVLIVGMHNDLDELGRATVWDESVNECVYHNHLIRFRANTSIVMPAYISRLLNLNWGRRQLITSGRTKFGLKSLSIRRVQELKVPVPTLALQQRFLYLLRKYQTIANKMECCKREGDNLFACLSQRAFRGEL